MPSGDIMQLLQEKGVELVIAGKREEEEND